MKRFYCNGILIFQIAFLICVTKGERITNAEIEGNFKHCELNEPLHHIDVNSLCDDDGISDQQEDWKNRKPGKTLSKTKEEAMIFVKHHYLVEGHGYKCSMKINQYKLEKDWLFAKHVDVSSKYVPLTRFDCLNMVESDKCGEKTMKCHNKDECFYEEPLDPRDEPSWLSITRPTQHVCSYKKIIILGKDNSTKLFKNAQSKCTANEHECILENSIVIWNKNIVRTCMFESVLYINDLMIHVQGKTLLYESKINHFLFKATLEEEKACDNIYFKKTIEGLYLVILSSYNRTKEIFKSPKGNLNINHLQDNDIREFMLAEVDYEKKNMLATISRTACSALINTIRSSIDATDKFLVINEFGLNDITVYINDGVPYLPVCTNVTKIEVLSTTSQCYRDIAVKYKIGYREINGFLRPSSILSQFSIIDDCKKNNKNLLIESGSVIVKRKSNKVIIEKYDKRLATRLRIPFLQEGSLNELFKHNQLLINASSSLEQMEEMIAIKEQDFTFFVKGNENIESNTASEESQITNFFSNVFNFLKSITGKIFSFIKYTFLTLLIILLALVLGYCIIWFVGYCLKNKPKVINMVYKRAYPEQVMPSVP